MLNKLSDTTNNTTNTPDLSDDLDAFSKEMFNPGSRPTEEETVEEAEDVEGEPEEAPETDENDNTNDEDTEEQEESSEEDEEKPAEEESKPKGKRSAQDRINELTREREEAKRRADAADERFRKLEEKLNNITKEKQTPTPEAESAEEKAPDPNAEDKDGKPVYPLGEFDPQYIRDLTRFTIKQENEAAAKQRKADEEQAKITQARVEAQTQWVSKVDEAEKEMPDIRTKINSLETMFEGVDPAYGQYLVDTVMSLDVGPSVLAYLADNPKEARDIVGAGATKATLMLGRLDARLAKVPAPKEPEAAPPKKTTKTATPPVTPRGNSGQFAVRADTDDLDAFNELLYGNNKKKK